MGASEPPTALATPADVRAIIATDLDDPQIGSFLSDAAAANADANDIGEMSDSLRTRIEKYYASFLIRSFRDRDASKAKRKSVNISYEGSAVEALKAKVRALDPSGELIPDGEAHTYRSASVGSARLHGNDGVPPDGDVRDEPHENGHRIPR